MIELTLIIFHVLLITSVFSINPLVLNKKLLYQNKNTLAQNISLNFLITANIVLVLSFFNLKLTEITSFYLIYLFLLFFFFFKNRLFKLSKKNINLLFDFFVIILISTIIFLDISNKLILSWDSEKFWLYKKLSFYNNYSIENLNNFTRPHYPFLGGLIGSFFWKLSFISNEYASRLFLGLVYVLSIYLLIENLKITKLKRLIILLLFILITYDYFKLFNGNQEILIFSFICFALNSCYKIKNRENIFLNLFIFFLSCNLLIWTKQEAYFYVFFLLFTLFFVLKLRIKQKIYFLFFLFFLIFLRVVVYKIYGFEISLNKDVANELSFQIFIESIKIERVLVVLKYFIFSFFQNLYLLFGLVLILINGFLKNKNFYINFYLLINIMFIFSAYLLLNDAQHPHEFQVKTGINRLIFNISPIIILLFVEMVNSKKNN